MASSMTWSQVLVPLSAKNRSSLVETRAASPYGSPPSTVPTISLPANRNLTPQFSAMTRPESQPSITSSPETVLSSASTVLSSSSSQRQDCPHELYNLQQLVTRQPGLHPTAAQTILHAASSVVNSCNDRLRLAQYEVGQLSYQLQAAKGENSKLKGELHAAKKEAEETTRVLKETTGERDISNLSNDQLRKQLALCENILRARDERPNSLIAELKEEKSELARQVKLLEEQIAGKKSMWLEGRQLGIPRVSVSEDPFATPTVGQKDCERRSVSFVSPDKLNLLALPSGKPTEGFNAWAAQSHGSHRGSSLAAGSRSEVQFSASTPATNRFTAPRAISTSSIKTSGQSELNLFVKDLRDDFDRVFALINGWTESYANIPNEENDRMIIKLANGEVWTYMMSMCSQHRYDSYSHVRVLLGDESTRHWFVMRMAVEYIKNCFWTTIMFHGFSDETTRRLTTISDTLHSARGMKATDRHALLTTQAEIVKSITDDAEYESFRKSALEEHTKKLRKLLGPVLNDDTCRADASRDISIFASKAWDLGVKMHGSNSSFQMIYPESQGRFVASSMVSVDARYLDRQPRELQLGQARIQLFVTPLINMRNDGGNSIIAKSIQLARVILS